MGFVLESNANLLEQKMEIHKYGEEVKVIEFSYNDITAEITDPFKETRCDVSWPGIWASYGIAAKEQEVVLGEGKKRFLNEEKVELR
jgi:hypothetical protein